MPFKVPGVNPRVKKIVEMTPLMLADETGGSDGVHFDTRSFDALTSTLQMPSSSQAMLKPTPPASLTDGVVHGSLMHQGKFRGAWKKGWFVLKPPFLFYYINSNAKTPKKAFYVSYAMPDRTTAEDVELEKVSSKYITRLEEAACSLRINVYTPDKVKVLTAPSEETMNLWLEHLQSTVRDTTPPEAMVSKDAAAEKLKPLLVAQMYGECDHFHKMLSVMDSMGLNSEGGKYVDTKYGGHLGSHDPRKSPDVVKAGKLKLLKLGLEEKSWQKFYFVLVNNTIYYYASRKNKSAKSKSKHRKDDDDEDEEEEDDEDADDMPWKGCINLTFATVGAAPESVSKKPRVFQLKTPLRTFYVKARHEVDAEDWMENICAQQRGEGVQTKLHRFNVYDDPLARKLEASPESIKLSDCLKHPLGLHYLCDHVNASNAELGRMLRIFLEIDAYKRKNVPQKKLEKAGKIYKEYLKDSKLVGPQVSAQILEQIDSELAFAAQEMFQPVERLLMSQAEPYFNTFVTSPMYKRLTDNQGTKIMTVSHVDSPDENVEIEGQVVVGRSKNLEGTGIVLKHDHKVSREHCRLDVGPLVTLVTDLGSSKGTRIESKSGKKITAEVLLPGQALFMGGYVLTYNLGGPKRASQASPSPTTKKKSGLFSRKSKGPEV